MTERIIDPEDHLSDIVATRRWAYLVGEGENSDLRFTDDDAEAAEHWHAPVTPGDYVPKSLPLKPPAGRVDVEPPAPTADDWTRPIYPRWIERLQRSRNGVEIVVASLVAGTAGALIGFGIGTIY